MKYVSLISILMLSLTLVLQTQAQPEPEPIQEQRQHEPRKPKPNLYPKPKPIAELTEAEKVVSEAAILDANSDVDAYDAVNWGIGSALASTCCPAGGLIVIATANSNTPLPPAKRLLGKTPVYIHQYAATYITGIQEKRSKAAITGCMVGSGVGVACLIYSASATSTAASDSIVGVFSLFELLEGCNF